MHSNLTDEQTLRVVVEASRVCVAALLNSPRGNVLMGHYHIQWTGPLYLK